MIAKSAPQNRLSRIATFVRAAAVGVVFFLLAWLCITLTRVSNNVAFIWFPNAIVFAYILRRPVSETLSYVFAVLVANVSANLLWGDNLPFSIGISLANCLEIFAAVYLCRRFDLLAVRLGNVSQYLTILAVYTLFSATMGATLGSAVVWLECRTPWWNTFQNWWLGDTLGFLMFGIIGLQLSVKEWKAYLNVKNVLVDAALFVFLFFVSESFLALIHDPFIFIAIPFSLVALFVGTVRASLQIVLSVTIVGGLYYLGVVPMGENLSHMSIQFVWLEIAISCFLPILVGVVTDELKRAKNEQQTIIDQMPVMMGYWDSNLINRFANKTYLEYFGKAPSHIKGIHIRELLGETRYQLNLPYINGVLAGEPQLFERIIVDVSGTKRYTIASYLPDVRNDQVVGFFVFVTDNTQLKLAQLGQREAQKKLQNVIDSATDFAIVSVDVDGVINLFNTGAEKMLGYIASEIVGKNSPLIYHEPRELQEKRQELERTVSRSMSNLDALIYQASLGLSSADNWTYVRGDKVRVPVHVVTTPMRDLSGAINGFLFVAKDIAKELQVQKNLSQAKEEAERANRVKSEFLASMSHEIRTPMNVMLGIAQLLRSTELDSTQKEYVEMLDQSGHTLMTIINDILDFSKIEAGKMESSVTTFDANQILRTLKPLTASIPATHSIEIVTRVDSSIPVRMVGDAAHIQQVLVNFVSNAIKFTERGTVTVELEASKFVDRRFTLAVRVRDTGIGIEADDLGRLFVPFSQLDASVTRKYGGTGLGLSICKRLVDLMNGSIGVESRLGEGSTFWFEVPCSFAPEPNQSQVETPNRSNETTLSGLRLLIVEDNPMNLVVAQGILTQLGARSETAANGTVAVETLRRRPLDFDCILMDLHMPEMDGLTATKVIRNELKSSVAIVAMTAGVLNSEERDSIEAGMDAYIAKPFQVEQMVETILRVTKRTS